MAATNKRAAPRARDTLWNVVIGWLAFAALSGSLMLSAPLERMPLTPSFNLVMTSGISVGVFACITYFMELVPVLVRRLTSNRSDRWRLTAD
jgi:polyferredoxin